MPAPTLDEIRAAIVAKIATVAGSGKVHDYERFTAVESKLLELYKSGKRIHGYHVRRVRTLEQQSAVGRYVVTNAWHVRGFMSLDDADATEKLFDIEIEKIRDAFRADETLGFAGLSTIDDEQAGVQVLESGPVMFAGVLSHAARLALTTTHYQ